MTGYFKKLLLLTICAVILVSFPASSRAGSNLSVTGWIRSDGTVSDSSGNAVDPATVEYLHIGKDVFGLKPQNFADNFPLLIRIDVDRDNSEYTSSDEGILFSKNMTRLLACPAKLNFNDIYIVPSQTETIGINAFKNSQIRQIDLNNVSFIYKDAFLNCKYLTDVTTDKNLNEISAPGAFSK